MYKGSDLLLLHADSVSKFAIKLARVLWSKDEIETRMFDPRKEGSGESSKSVRPPLDIERTEVFKGIVISFF